MANNQLKEAAAKASLDKKFTAWLKSIGEQGLKLIRELFKLTALKDLKLAAMAQEDPESTMILFAYQVYLQLSKLQASENTEEPQETYNDNELEDMNNPPTQSPISAKFGAKLKHISELNGHCPEGYEMAIYRVGGRVCGKCMKKKQLLQNMACGGKKRIKKSEEGSTLYAKCGKSLTKSKANSLKYDGGPGDINSTQGMKPNKKQRKAMKRIGGMINGAKKIDIYGQPGMFDYVKLN